jgi:hypothetical protein
MVIDDLNDRGSLLGRPVELSRTARPTTATVGTADAGGVAALYPDLRQKTA